MSTAYPDWGGALVYYLRNHADMVDPAGGASVEVTPRKQSSTATQPPGPIVVVRKEPGFAHRYVPKTQPRVGLWTYHSTEKNAGDLMNVVLAILDPYAPHGNGISVQMPVSLGSEIIRFDNFEIAQTPFTDFDEGWAFAYCALITTLHMGVLT